MDKNYKHATDMEERLRRASDAAIVRHDNPGRWVSRGVQPQNTPRSADPWPQPRCADCGIRISYYDQMVPGDQVKADGTPDQVYCLGCAAAIARERRHGRDPAEDFNPTRWAVLCAVVILVIITLNVI